MTDRMPPQADGLYDPRYEHDACGVAMVARLDNVPGHDVVDKALEALDNLEHRGAEGADIRTGDGAGLLLQLPHALLPRHRRLRAARARALRRLRLLPAARRGPPPPDRGAARAQRPRRGPARARLARRADRRGPRRRHGQRLAPAHPPALHRGRARASSTTRTPSSASSTSSGASSSSPSARSSTRRRARAGPASTRGCSRRPSCAASTPTCRTSASPARWRWCTAASRRTPSRAGSSPIPTA